MIVENANRIAIVGAGPAGLVVARWLLAAGLEPVLFEASGAVGGQWNPTNPASATWPGMRTNTSRILSRFSDLNHAAGLAVFPRREDMHAYLQRYAAAFDLRPRIRLDTLVERIERSSSGWALTSRGPAGAQCERFAKVIVATGAEGTQLFPDVPGLDRFTGALGAIHSRQYGGAERYRGRSVLVAGCSISALEIASELALGGAEQVFSTYRRQRYVLPKVSAGVPTDNVMFTRIAAASAATLTPEALAGQLLDMVVKAGGKPEQYGAHRADENIFVAGITQAQNFLPAVADGRIAVKPWIERIEGRTVHFLDGTSLEPDCIIFGSGYRPNLSFLPKELRDALAPDGGEPDLFEHTLHPDLPGLAFLGLYNLVGPKLPVLELQARWVAQLFSGEASLPSGDEQRRGVAAARVQRQAGMQPAMHTQALAFANRAGVEPDPARWPQLRRTLMFGPLSPASFRLEGPHTLAAAEKELLRDASAFGAIAGDEFTPAENSVLKWLEERQLSVATA